MRLALALLTLVLLRADMFPDASNAKLPEASANLKTPWFYVEAYRIGSDPAGDDTAVVQRACDAARQVNGRVVFGGRQYNISTLTLGDTADGTKCDLQGANWPGVVDDTYTRGTQITQIANTNASMFIFPDGIPTVVVEDLRINGNKANQNTTTCAANAAAIFSFPSSAGPGKKRSVYMRNVTANNACYNTLTAGFLRNAGVLDHVTFLAAANTALALGANSDWRAINSDFYAAEYALRCAACGTFTSIASNYFSSRVNIRIDADATDVTFLNGSCDRALQNCVEIVGSNSARPESRTFIGMSFTVNGTAAGNTYADVNVIGENNASFIGTKHMRSTLAEVPQYTFKMDEFSRILVSGTSWDKTTPPYTAALTNSWGRIYGDAGMRTNAIEVDTAADPVVIDFAAMSSTLDLTLTANRTIPNPANIRAGVVHILNLTNSGAGAKTITWGGSFRWAAGTPPVLSAADGALDTVRCLGTRGTTAATPGLMTCDAVLAVSP